MINCISHKRIYSSCVYLTHKNKFNPFSWSRDKSYSPFQLRNPMYYYYYKTLSEMIDQSTKKHKIRNKGTANI